MTAGVNVISAGMVCQLGSSLVLRKTYRGGLRTKLSFKRQPSGLVSFGVRDGRTMSFASLPRVWGPILIDVQI